MAGRIKRIVFVLFVFLFTASPALTAIAQQFTVFKSFTATDGVALSAISSNTLYGTAAYGGISSNGMIFKMSTDGTGFTVIKNFNGKDGRDPFGLRFYDNTLYGMTGRGGSANDGTLFKINMDGTGFAVLKNFTGKDGASPDCLIISGNALYGTTNFGGSKSNGALRSGDGVLFKINIDGTGFKILKNFGGKDGENPGSRLILSNDKLYGTTVWGGDDNWGTLYRINTDGTDFTVLRTFREANMGPVNPNNLVLSDGALYGTTTQGGSLFGGTVFRMNTDGTGFTVIKNCAINTTGDPPLSLTLSDGALYVTTIQDESGGQGTTCGHGTIFKINTDGTDFALLKSFSGPDGAQPFGTFIFSGDTIYGATAFGGASDKGTIFKINTDGTGFSTLKTFSGSMDGYRPMVGLCLLGHTLYGATSDGDGWYTGTLFKINTDGTGFAVLKNFTSNDGTWPNRLTISGDTLYGTTEGGGSLGYGTIFKINTDGTGFAILKSCDVKDGNGIHDLTLSGHTLYGTTGGGGDSMEGTIFKINTDGTGFAVIKSFTGPYSDQLDIFTRLFDPLSRTVPGVKIMERLKFEYLKNNVWSNPEAGVTLSGDTLYGTTADQGSDGGMVFKIKTDGTDFTVLKKFSSGQQAKRNGQEIFTNSDGYYPRAKLLVVGDTIFGTTERGGSGGEGTIFKINTDGTGFTVIKNFSGKDGIRPTELTLSGNTLYGTTVAGGNSKSLWFSGTIFKVNTDGTGFAVLKNFTGENGDGGTPLAGLNISGNTLYGTTWYGGDTNNGTVFRLELPPSEQNMATTAPASGH